MKSSGNKIVVIGAGVLGASTALALQADGHQVLLVDRSEPCAGASYGNAGAVVDASCVPIAMPGMIKDVLGMIGKPMSPLSIRPTYFPQILPWLIRLVNESRSSRAMNNARNLHALASCAADSWRQMIDNTALQPLLREGGWLKVFESERSFLSSAPARNLMDKIGTPYAVLSKDEIHDLEPQLAPIFKRAIYQENCLRVINPQAMVIGMVDLMLSRGGQYQQFDVQQIQLADDGVRLKNASDSLSADKVVLAAGAWSRVLAKQMGDKVPLDVERGYHLMLPEQTHDLLSRPVMNMENSFLLSPLQMGIRLSCQVEFAGLDGVPDYRRVRSLLPKAKRMLPAIDITEQSVWMGHRPSLPDSIPVLGFSTKSERVVYAFGHQHLGITMGPVTGLLIADLLSGRNPKIDLHPYRADRF